MERLARGSSPKRLKSDESQFDLQNLPSIILLNIFRHLPLRDRIIYRQVNKKWASVSDQSLTDDVKHVEMEEDRKWALLDDDRPPTCGRECSCDDRRHSKNTLSIGKIDQSQFDRLFALFGRNLKSIKFGGKIDSPTILLKSPDAFPELEKIEFTYDCKEISMSVLFDLLEKCPKLKILTGNEKIIRSENYEIPPGKIYGLEKFKLGWSREFTKHDLRNIADHCPNLIEFSIHHHKNLYESGFANFLKKCPKLETLDFSWGWFKKISHGKQVIDIAGCPNLINLDLANTNVVTDQLLMALSTGCLGLKKLDISGAEIRFSNAGIGALASLPDFEDLRIGYQGIDLSEGVKKIALKGNLVNLKADRCPLTPSCLKLVMKECTKLKNLDISYNPKMGRATDAAALIRVRNDKKFSSLNQAVTIRCSGKNWDKPVVMAVLEELGRRFGDADSIIQIDCRNEGAELIFADEQEGLANDSDSSGED